MQIPMGAHIRRTFPDGINEWAGYIQRGNVWHYCLWLEDWGVRFSGYFDIATREEIDTPDENELNRIFNSLQRMLTIN